MPSPSGVSTSPPLALRPKWLQCCYQEQPCEHWQDTPDGMVNALDGTVVAHGGAGKPVLGADYPRPERVYSMRDMYDRVSQLVTRAERGEQVVFDRDGVLFEIRAVM